MNSRRFDDDRVAFSFERTLFPREGLKARWKRDQNKSALPGFRGLLLKEGGRRGLFLIFVRFSSCPVGEASFLLFRFRRRRLEPSSIPENTQIRDLEGGGRKYGMIFVSSSHPDQRSFTDVCCEEERGF